MTTALRGENAAIGERVHRMLWRHKVTNTAASKAIGIDQSALSKKLRGERPWYAHELVGIAQLLNSTVGYLYGETNNPHPAGGPDGGCSVCAVRDSNPEPADTGNTAAVLAFPTAGYGDYEQAA